MSEVEKAWSDVQIGERVRWLTPTFVKFGKIMSKKGRAMRVQFDRDPRPTVIPDAKWYFVQHKLGDKENGLVVWDGDVKAAQPLPNAHDRYVTAAEASHTFGVTVKELRRWLRAGKVHGYQELGLWMVDEQSLGRWMADRG